MAVMHVPSMEKCRTHGCRWVDWPGTTLLCRCYVSLSFERRKTDAFISLKSRARPSGGVGWGAGAVRRRGGVTRRSRCVSRRGPSPGRRTRWELSGGPPAIVARAWALLVRWAAAGKPAVRLRRVGAHSNQSCHVCRSVGLSDPGFPSLAPLLPVRFALAAGAWGGGRRGTERPS